MNNIVIIDYWMWNLGSILNMIKKNGVEAIISNDIDIINKADKLILPWVWNFYMWMEQLNKLGLIDIIKEKVLKFNTPILWICLWYQLLANKSEEWNVNWLWLIDANVIKFDCKELDSKWLKSIHMWWNCIKLIKKSILFKDIWNEPRFYFVHSYFMENNNKEDILSISNYWKEFTSSIEKNNIFWVQFHPEKSHKFWEKLIYNFIYNI